ncbi:U3 small nucleolar RNA-associated protein 13 [Thelotrema lepadinum]|nr:U3 small nucleolar RNA-associated protein 13 [Thelotrema lepadinum]
MRIYSLDRPKDADQFDVSLLRKLKPHGTPVVSIAVDVTGTLLATGSADGVIKVWDIRGGYVSHTFRGHSGVISSLSFFELPSELVRARATSKHKKKSKKFDHNYGDQDTNGDLPTSDRSGSTLHLASGGEDSKIRIWNLEKRTAVASLESHVSVVRGLDFCKAQQALLSSSRDKTLIIWDAKTWTVKRIVPVLESIEAAGFLCKGRLIYSGGENGRLRIWETQSGREITKVQEQGGEDEGITDILCIPQKDSLLCVHEDQTLAFHSTSRLDSILPGESIEPLPVLQCISGTHDEIIDLAYLGIERNVMALATNTKSVKLISVEMQAQSIENIPYFGAEVGQLQGHEDIVICLDVDWSGRWIATGAKDNAARLWQIDHSAKSYQCVATFTGHTESIGAIALPTQLPQKESAAFQDPLRNAPNLLITGSQDKTVKVWEISRRKEQKSRSREALYTRKAHDKDINALAINHNSSLFASASQDRTVKIWSTQNGDLQGVLRGHKRGVWSVRFAPKDTPNIVSESGATISSQGTVLTGSGDKTVKLWSLSDYSCIRTFEGHTNTVLKVLWLPQIKPESTDSATTRTQTTPLVASAASDGLVRVWDTREGECACTLDNHTDRVWALATNSITGQLVSGGGDGVVTFWVDTTASTAAAREAASAARVEQEQALTNHVHRGNYRDAIVLSLQLNHPARLLSLFKDVVAIYPPEQGSLSGLRAVDDVLVELDDEQLFTLLLRLRDWNTNARTAYVAQRIFWVVAKSYPASRLVGLRKRGRGLGGVLEALRVYTERHYKRVEEGTEESYLVDFVWEGMEQGRFAARDLEGPENLRMDADTIIVE